MKAIVINGPGGDFAYSADRGCPECPEGWAVVKVAYCGICGSDLPRFGCSTYRYPSIAGHEFSGEVVKTAAGGRAKPGDKVAILPLMPCMKCGACRERRFFHCEAYQFIGSRNDGGFAEYCAVKEDNIFILPGGMDMKEAALIEPALVGLHAARRSGFKAGDRAIVFGAGPIGLMTASWLRFLGAGAVCIADIREYSLGIARKMGFSDAVDPSSAQGKFDVAYEASGAGEALHNGIRLVKEGGTVTVVGRDANDTLIPRALFETLMRKELSVLGCWGYEAEGEEALLYAALQSGALRLGELITHVIPCEAAVETIKKMLNREMDYCKILVEF